MFLSYQSLNQIEVFSYQLSYPFYVELDSSDGLMLGQHVYIERDIGQDEQKDGLWISDYYIVDADTNEPYVWAANDKKKLEKRYVTLGSGGVRDR